MSEYKRGDFSGDDDRRHLPELVGEFERPIYAPTPFNPYDLKKDGIAYIQTAQEAINEVFRRNLLRLEERPPKTMIDLLRVSITSALFRRFDNNSGKTIPPDCDDETAQLFADACLGKASPAELIELLSRHPGDIESIELAKQTHPFDWSATAEMDVAVDTILSSGEFAKRDGERTQNIRYYFMRSDDNSNPAAIIMVRKADLGIKSGNEGDVVVVQRDSFVLDLRHPDAQEASREFHLWLQSDEARAQIYGNKKTPYRRPLLTEFISDQLTTRTDLRSTAIYPGVRSYYAYCNAVTDGDSDIDGEA